MSFEKVIFSNLLNREDFARKTFPFIKEEYFKDVSDRIVFGLIKEYVDKYNRFPTTEAISIELANKSMDEKTFQASLDTLSSAEFDPKTELEWLVDKTEKFCQERAIYNAIMASIQIIDNKDEKHGKGSIPKLLSDALGVNFDTNIGHNFFDDSMDRFDYYHRILDRVPFSLNYLNKITKGGLPKKTLSVVLAGTGVGKSLFMCNNAAHNLKMGKNVLYITLEMAEEEIAKRIDANMMNVTIDELESMSKETFTKKIDRLRSLTDGKLIIKEYPNGSAGASHFRHLLNELKLKKNFVPDIIYIDYINICCSSRLKQGPNVNSYTYIKAIAEEIRALAVEFNLPIFSATQTTRSGSVNSDIDLTDTSESFGLPMTVDFMFALMSNEELEQLGQMLVKQLKNRFRNMMIDKKFVIGIDRLKMKLYDCEELAQEDIIQADVPIMDRNFGPNQTKKFNLQNFDDFK